MTDSHLPQSVSALHAEGYPREMVVVLVAAAARVLPDRAEHVVAELELRGLLNLTPEEIDGSTTTEEVKMDKPDLAALAAEANDIAARITAFQRTLNEARDATLGEWDEVNDREIAPGNGDDYEIFVTAAKRANEASLIVGAIVTDLATQQGLRDFDAVGVEAL